MQPSRTMQKLAAFSGCAVLISVVLMLLSMAFLRGGHPPGYGIANLIILLLIYPLSVLGSIIGFRTTSDTVEGSPKRYFLLIGACMTFALFGTVLLILKFGLGKPI